MKLKYFFLFIITCIMCSCEQHVDLINDTHNLNNEIVQTDFEKALQRPAIIGEKIPNPYSFDIMNKALKNLQTKSGINDIELKPTHHYVMFKPECHEHYRSLIMQDDLDLNSFPLDHEISDGWIVVNPDPAYSTNGYSHKWSYVPVDRDLDDICCPYEILYDIVAIDDEVATTKSDQISSELFIEMEKEAHRLCGIELNAIPETRATNVTPSGNIKYFDSSYDSYIGCYGMSVKANRLTKKTYGHCDDNGNFICDKSFKYNWTYTVFFSRTDFEMRRDTTSTEEISLVFTKQHGPLNLTFSTSSSYIDCIFYCEILRAACKYFYGEIDGLRRPPFKDELKDRLYIQAMRGSDPNKKLNGFFQPYASMKSIPFMRIYRDNPVRRESSEIYWTTIHELAHSVHWKQNISVFRETETKVTESYASGIAWYLTKKVHPNHIRRYSGNYTGIVEDLLDNDGFKAQSSFVHEYVSGFTIQEIETSVIGAKTWDEWNNNIIRLYPYNPTISNVNNLFTLW